MARFRMSARRQTEVSVDTSNDAYVEISKNLDTILWQHTATFVAVAGLGINSALQVFEKRLEVFNLNFHSTGGVILQIMPIVLISILHAMTRLRHHLNIFPFIPYTHLYGPCFDRNLS